LSVIFARSLSSDLSPPPSFPDVRSIVKIDSPVFGTVFAVCVGAMMVGSIHHEMKVGDTVKKGDEMGYFAFGSSRLGPNLFSDTN